MIAWGALLACAPPEPATVRTASARVTVDDHAVALEVPIRTLDRRGGPRVVLAGTVHVADPSFYAAVSEALAGCTVVLREGLAADPSAPAFDDGLGPLLEARGLVRQGEALEEGAGWRTVDGSVAEVRAALIAAGAPDGEAGTLLDDRSQSDLRALLEGLPADPRSTALARFTVLRGVAAPTPTSGGEADRYWEVVVGARDRRVVDAVVGEGPIGVVYGADHLADLEARLVDRGWTRVDERWLPALSIPLDELQLGPAQVRQLLGP